MLAYRGAHLLEHRIRATVVCPGFAIHADILKCNDVQPLGLSHRQRPQRSASISRNADVQAPMARASDRIAEAEVAFLFMSCRQPKTASARSESS
ncbi:MAG TPA: hypothetical protein VGZ73_22625, partial [Bryobacteraceae bacterium]|nr:hypothetical protein [Bryobacteraceae bacterium]